MSSTPVELEYDIIFAGGGATACVTAGRLAAADPTLRILILEDGPETRDKPVHIQPGRYVHNFRNPTFEGIVRHVGRPSQALGGRTPLVFTGRCLGGGSSINSMVYSRAAASDYDDWERKYKNPGWSSKDLIPLLQKAETFDRSAPSHGNDGPIKVSYRENRTNVADDFLDVAAKYDDKRTFTSDTNDFFTCDAYARWPRYIDTNTGRRSDAAHHYIYNQLDRNQNLVVACGKRVIRVLFEGTRATGVEYIGGPDGRKSVSKASRLVVLSAGAFGSPAILERSGIGSTDLLHKNSIKQLVDLPGVGEHYMDHNHVAISYAASEDAETIQWNQVISEASVQQWLETGKGPLAHNGTNAGIKIRPHAEDLPELGKEFEEVWREYYEPAPDKPLLLIFTFAGDPSPDPATMSNKFISFFYFSSYPTSVGFVHISSGTDPYAPLNFHPGFFDKPVDIGVLRWGYKKVREIARRMKMYRGELVSDHPDFNKGSEAECKSAASPSDINSPDISYTEADNEAIDQYHRRKVTMTGHSMGTCAMKPREDGGVVDSRLNVYGTQCLKVADCSISPANVGVNTYNTALAIGEKAAVLIAEELGIKSV